MRTIQCKGGYVVEIIDDDHWVAPYPTTASLINTNIDFGRLPHEVRPWWRAVLEGAYRTLPPAYAQRLWNAALWLTRYQRKHGKITAHLDSLECADWGNFAAWLKTQKVGHDHSLTYETCRGYFVSLTAAAKQAILLSLPGTSGITIDRLHAVSRAMFKERIAERKRRIERRSLSAEQYTDLYTLMAEEWQRFLDKEKDTQVEADLPPLVACWLAFNDGLRSCELNVLTVSDIQADPLYGKHQLRAHAPNKEPDMIPIENDTLLLLRALISAGAETRSSLQTDRLFVSTQGKPRVLTTQTLNTALRLMLRRHDCTSLPYDLKLPDGRTTFGTFLVRGIHNRERVRRIMRHCWISTTEAYYEAQQKLVVAGNIAKALRAEALRLTIACQRPVIHIREQPEQVDILRRNPDNANLEWGSCGLDIKRQGACRRASHCFDCPLLVPWVSKRHNYVAERDVYLRLASEAKNPRDRENLLYHANQAQAYLFLIDRRLEEQKNGIQSSTFTRQRRARIAKH